MSSSVRRIDSVAGGPVFDWSGAWVRAVEPLAEEAPRSEAIASFLAENGGVSFVFQPIVDARRTPPSRYALECLVRGPAGTPYADAAHLFEFFRCRGHLVELDEYCLVSALAEGASLPGEGSVVVRVLWRDPWTRQCVEGALRLGEELGFRVVAQGVESARDLDAVLRCGIDLVQGFLTGPPVPRLELEVPAATRGA
jgi:EAL domain-containing protein (putative c-di-GMP-specific phosphodiesterase class I)